MKLEVSGLLSTLALMSWKDIKHTCLLRAQGAEKGRQLSSRGENDPPKENYRRKLEY